MFAKVFDQKIRGILILILSIGLAAAINGLFPLPNAVLADAPQQATSTYNVTVPAAITLDGDFADWSGIPYISVVDGPQPAPTPQDGSLQFAVAADSQNLYFSVLVTDSKIVANQHNEQYWLEDSVEIYLNTTGNLELTSYTPGVVQVTIPAANIGRSLEQAIITGTNWKNARPRAIVVGTRDGYAIEAAVPLVTDQWRITPTAETKLGFQIQLNGATQLDRDIKLSWSALDKTADQSYQNPSVFGQLIFPAASPDNTLAITQPEPTPEPTKIPPTPLPSAATTAGNFTVRDAKIYDPQGNEFIAKGVNVSGYNWVWQRKTVNDVDLIANCWKFNLVRVNSFLFTGQVPYKQYDVNNNLDEIVQTFTQRGIVVVFEGHDRIGSYYEGEDLNTLVAWFTDLANRYKDNPYVWFDVMNEPGARYEIDVDNWLGMHQAVIRGIRDVAGAQNIIIVEGAHGGQDTIGWYGNPVPDEDSAILSYANAILNFDNQAYTNIVFSIHTYDQWNYGDDKMADFFDRVLDRGLALIIGEYGPQTDVNTQAAVDSLFNTAVPRGIGRVVWHWDGGDANDLTINTSQGGGWEINDCANPTNLSDLGQRVWNDNHSG